MACPPTFCPHFYEAAFFRAALIAFAFVIAEHVATTPGGSHDAARIADALVLDTWGCARHELTETERERRNWRERYSIHGFEVKVSRSDWLTELADPTKAEVWAQHCHYFWLVAADKNIVRGDLPATWGLLVPHGSSLRAVKKPIRRDPEPLTLAATISLARAVQKTDVAMAAVTEQGEAENR